MPNDTPALIHLTSGIRYDHLNICNTYIVKKAYDASVLKEQNKPYTVHNHNAFISGVTLTHTHRNLMLSAECPALISDVLTNNNMS